MQVIDKAKPAKRRRPKDGFVMNDPIAEIESAILEKIRSGPAVPHQRILPLQKWVKHLGASRYRVEKAISRLSRKGLVYGRQGSGVYLTEKAFGLDQTSDKAVAPASDPTTELVTTSESAKAFNFDDIGVVMTMPHVPLVKTLRIKVSNIQADEIQIDMWRRVFDAFHREHPFVNLEPDFSNDNHGSYDAVITSLSAFRDNLSAQRPLEPRMLAQGGFDPDVCVDGVLDQGRIAPSQELFGLPLLRTVAILAVNHRLFRQHGVQYESITRLADWFRAGFSLQEKSGGRISGFNYGGFQFYGTFYGITLREEDGRCVFDRARMARLLEDIKPCFYREHLSNRWNLNKFFDNTLGICCNYLSVYPWIVKCMKKAADLVRLPLDPGGFVPGSGLIGTVPAGAGSVEEATVLLGFIASEKGQTALVEDHPEWLSVHQAVLARQMAASPFPEGSVIHEYDSRSVSYSYPFQSFDVHVPRMETEAVKFYLGLQGLKETLDKMEGRKQ